MITCLVWISSVDWRCFVWTCLEDPLQRQAHPHWSSQALSFLNTGAQCGGPREAGWGTYTIAQQKGNNWEWWQLRIGHSYQQMSNFETYGTWIMVWGSMTRVLQVSSYFTIPFHTGAIGFWSYAVMSVFLRPEIKWRCPVSYGWLPPFLIHF